MAAGFCSLYELGYDATNTERDGTFRKVVINVDGDGSSHAPVPAT